MTEYNKLQKVDWGFQINANKKGHLIGNRVFATYSDMVSYISTKTTSAVPGLILVVTDDGDDDLNGAYLVKQVAGVPEDNLEYNCVKLATGEANKITLSPDTNDEVATLENGVLTIKDMRTYWDDQSFN